MNIFVTENPIVEILVDVNGKPYAAKTNIVPNVLVRVVGPDTADEGLPFEVTVEK